MTRQGLGSLVGVAIGILGIGFVALRLARDWTAVSDAFADTAPGWAAVAFAAGVAAMSAIGLNWVALLRSRMHSLSATRGLSWFFVGQLGKYVPGGIWPVVGQAELAVRGGAGRRDAYASTATSMVATLTGAATFASIAGLVASADHRWIAGLIGAAVVAMLSALACDALRARAERAIARMARRPVSLPTGRFLAVQTLRHLPVWVLFAMMNVAVVVALDGSQSFRLFGELAFATAVSWMAGFVVIGLPGGIGVREAVLVSIMTGPLGPGVALSVAITSRVVSVLVDVAAAGSAPLVATITD